MAHGMRGVIPEQESVSEQALVVVPLRHLCVATRHTPCQLACCFSLSLPRPALQKHVKCDEIISQTSQTRAPRPPSQLGAARRRRRLLPARRAPGAAAAAALGSAPLGCCQLGRQPLREHVRDGFDAAREGRREGGAGYAGGHRMGAWNERRDCQAGAPQAGVHGTPCRASPARVPSQPDVHKAGGCSAHPACAAPATNSTEQDWTKCVNHSNETTAPAAHVIMGLTPVGVGKVEPSAQYRPATSQHSPEGSSAEVAGSAPAEGGVQAGRQRGLEARAVDRWYAGRAPRSCCDG